MFVSEFVIPANRNDLRESVGSRQYCVDEVLSSREIASGLQECQTAFKETGPSFILDKFDIFYSVLNDFSNLHQNIKEDSWQLILKSCKVLHSELMFVLDESDLDKERKNDLRNTLKMLVYVMCQLAGKFEDDATKPATDCVVAGGKGRKKAKKPSIWETERANMVELFSELCQQPFHVLWDPPVVEDEFVCLVTNCCYKLLENPSIVHNKLIKTCVFQLLGHMIRKHSHTIGCSLKIIQLIQQHEHLTAILAEGVALFVEEYGAKNIISEILREVGQMDGKEMCRDTAGTRSMAAFLLELARNLPTVVLGNMSLVLLHLEQESYTLRNSVLGMIVEVVLKLLSGDHLDRKDRKTRNQLLDYLEDHMHDVNAFVRSRVLQLWLQLVQEKAVPLPRQRFVLKNAIGRLHDKSSNVRRHAIDLVTAFVQSNPFAAKLTVEELKENYEKELNKLNELITAEEQLGKIIEDQATKEANGCDDSTLSDVENKETEATVGNLEESKTNLEQSSDQDNASQSLENPTEAAKQQVVVQYLKETVEFAEYVDQAIPIMCQLLGSKHNSDALASIEFFVVATEFGMGTAICGVRQMLLLIWSQEQTIKEAVVQAYQRLYLQPNISCRRTKAINIVKNLSTLAVGATLGELTSLESLICELVKSDQLDGDILQVLWEQTTKKFPNTSDRDCRMAVLLLAFAAGAKKDVALSNVEVLVDAGLGKEAENDFRLAAETCTALLKLVDRKPSTESLEPPPRFPSDHIIFTRLVDILVKGVCRLDDKFWIPLMEKATSLIYLLADHPDTVCGDLLKKLSLVLQDKEDGTSEDPDNDAVLLKSSILCRLLSTVGQVAFCHLTYLDVHAFSEIKRRQFVQEEKAKKKSKQPTMNTRRSVGTCASALTTPRSTVNADNEGGDDELGLAGATADDTEAEYIRNICDKDIVTGQNLLAIFSPVIIEVCSSPNKYPNPDLLAAASSALSKFMLVSANFCEDNLQLLFTIMEKSPEPVIRGNTVIALGDLAFRFPNMIDPWTSHLYARLRDSSEKVRQSTLTVLTHLILNDMIKVKGQISDMAICVVDESERISGLAKLFFQELGKKDNAIYNILPDVISRLSDPEVGTEEEKFRNILKFLIAFVRKDRQLESLVEKLCQRFRATRTDRQARDLAYCLSQLSFNHKCLLKLQENFSCFADKLAEQFIFDAFTVILSGAKKLAKPDTKTIIEDLEQKIEEANKKGLDEEAIVANANKAAQQLQNGGKTPKSAAKTTRGRKGKTSTAARHEAHKVSSKDGDESFVAATERKEVTGCKDRPNRRSHRTAIVFSDDSKSDDDEQPVVQGFPQEAHVSRRSIRNEKRITPSNSESLIENTRNSVAGGLSEITNGDQSDISTPLKNVSRKKRSGVLEDKPPTGTATKRSSRRINQSMAVDTCDADDIRRFNLDESNDATLTRRPVRHRKSKGDEDINKTSVLSSQAKQSSRRRPLSRSSNDSENEITEATAKPESTPGIRRSARRR